MAVLMLFADVMGFAAAGILLYILNIWVRFFVFQWRDLRYISILPICLILYATTKLYPGIGINPAEEIKLIFTYTCIGFIIAILTFDLKAKWNPNYWAFVPFGLLSMTLVLEMRWFVRVSAAQAKIWGEPVAILARGSQIDRLTRYFIQRRRLGFTPVLAVTDSAGKKANTNPLPVIDLRRLLDMDSSHPLLKNIDTILVDASFFGHGLRSKFYGRLFSMFRHVIFVSDMGWMEGASLTVHDFEGLTGIEARRNLLSPTSSAIKRAMDIIVGLFGMLLFAPFLVLLIVLIKLESPGPVFYFQGRISGKERRKKKYPGDHLRKIVIIKFRTMYINADQMLADHLANNSNARLEWEQTQKLRNDPRITRVGKWLRKFSIDEIPQLFNVLKGEMSLVGPRPMMTDQIMRYGENIEAYNSVRPGITGLWQVSGRNNTTFQERASFDLYYVRNWSVWLDLYILARTVWVVLSRDGAY